MSLARSAILVVLGTLGACASDPPARTPTTVEVAARQAGPTLHADPVPPPPPPSTPETFPSYEEAINAHAKETPPPEDDPSVPLTDAQLAGPMRNATFITTCGAPDTMKVIVRIAVQNGKAVGVSVSTDPADSKIATCVDRYVRVLSWTRSPRFASFTTAY